MEFCHSDVQFHAKRLKRQFVSLMWSDLDAGNVDRTNSSSCIAGMWSPFNAFMSHSIVFPEFARHLRLFIVIFVVDSEQHKDGTKSICLHIWLEKYLPPHSSVDWLPFRALPPFRNYRLCRWVTMGYQCRYFSTMSHWQWHVMIDIKSSGVTTTTPSSFRISLFTRNPSARSISR